MMYPETNFNYNDNNMNNENKGNRKQRRQNKQRRNLHKAAAILAGVAVIGGSFWGGSLLTQNSTTTVQAASTLNLANDETTPDIVSSSLTDYSELAAECLPQVVSVTNVIEVTSTSNGGSDMFNFFYGSRGQSQGQTSTQESEAYGSGVIIGKTDDELLIVTNNHVAVYDKSGNTMYYSYTASTTGRKVTFVDGTEVDANLKGADADADIAVLAVSLSDIPEDTLNAISVATIDNSDDVKVGQGVMAIGNALGLGQTTTFGHVSALNKDVTTSDDNVTRSMMQIDAAINEGNSGGGLFDANGHLIGINSAKSSGEGVEGMGYAIPISSVEDLINNMMNQKTKVQVDEDQRGYLGIQGVDVPSEYVEKFGMPEGAMVTKITAGSPAETAGLQVSDIITAVDGQKVTSYDALRTALSYYAVGESVTITVQRPSGNQYTETELTVTLTDRASITDTTEADSSEEAESSVDESDAQVQMQKAE